MSTSLGREDIRSLLDELSAELSARGTRAELFLVGGAALPVGYDATRATRDLDAVLRRRSRLDRPIYHVRARREQAQPGLGHEQATRSEAHP